MRQSERWIRYLSLAQLSELEAENPPNRAAVAQVKHIRRAAPIIGVVLILLGLPFFLDRSPANILSDTGKCTIACGACYVTTFVVQSLQPGEGSALFAWIPIFVFGPVAVVMLDRVKT